MSGIIARGYSFRKGKFMPTFMFQGCYTPAAIAGMIKKAEDRTPIVRGLAETLGGKLIGFWLSFGNHDFVGIVELPDSQSAAAFALATGSSGALHNFQTVELLPWSEGIKALKKAGELRYQSPIQAGK
jgi:uncharacterized protein with GYD domain